MATPIKRMATKNPLYRSPRTSQKAVIFHRLDRVLAAGGRKTT